MARDVSGLVDSHRIINGCGIYTDLGGSRLSPRVWAAMTEANGSFVRMVDLLDDAGQRVADHLGAEAGLVTTGAAASIALMVAGAVTRGDGAAGERLPLTEGLPCEVVLQRCHRYKYDRQITMTGARLVLVGDEHGASEADLEAAIGPRTAAVFLPAHLDGVGGTVPLARMVALARRRQVPVLVDAAYLCWPLETLPALVRAGADLVCASAKYFGGPNAGGFIVGTRQSIAAVRANNFTRYESGTFRTFGRPFKIDRQTVVGVVAAFEEWLTMDHAARWRRYAAGAARLRKACDGAPGIRARTGCFTMDERVVPEPVNALVLDFEPNAPVTAAGLARGLAEGRPPILVVAEAARVVVCLDVVSEEEIEVIATRLAQLCHG